MESPDQVHGAAQVIATTLNLALTAWIIHTTRNTASEVKRNTRFSRRAAKDSHDVKEKTNGALAALVKQLEDAALKVALATVHVHKMNKRRSKKPPTKPHPKHRRPTRRR
jgi:hypothetical protein